MGAFGPDGLSARQFDDEVCSRNTDDMLDVGPQMHLDAVRLLVENYLMAKLTQNKICAQFSVDPCQEITIESCGHPPWIIVRGQQCINWLLKVCAEEEKIALQKYSSQLAQKVCACVAVEISDGAT